MTDKTTNRFLLTGLLITIALCVFSIVQNLQGGSVQKAQAEGQMDIRKKENTNIVEMLVIGLEQGKKAKSDSEKEQYYAMVEAAIRQSANYPETAKDIWRIFRQHIETIPDVTVMSKISLVDIFMDNLDSSFQQCKSTADFNDLWQVRTSATQYRQSIIDKAAAEAIAMLKEAEKTDSTAIGNLLFDKATEEQKSKYENAFLILSSDFAEEPVSDTVQIEFTAMKEKALKSQQDKICKQFDAILAKWEQLKNPPENNSDIVPAEKGLGVLNQLLMELQTFISENLNESILTRLSGIDQGQILLVQTQAAELMNKIRQGIQMRYNLWANYVIYNSVPNGYAQLPTISPEYLYSYVNAVYSEKQSEIFNKVPNVADFVNSMILEKKVPLTAF